jgi:hypothetical protein
MIELRWLIAAGYLALSGRRIRRKYRGRKARCRRENKLALLTVYFVPVPKPYSSADLQGSWR